MGYRSDVYCQIELPNKTSEEVIEEMKERYRKEDLIEHFTDLFNNIYIKKESNHCNIIFTSYGVKWYEGFYSEVDLFMKIIGEIGDQIEENAEKHKDWQEKYKEGYVYYIRIGENMDDTDEQIWGYADQDLEFVRSVVFKEEMFEDIKENK